MPLRAGLALRAREAAAAMAWVRTLAITIIGLLWTEVIQHEGPWRGENDVENATLDWVRRFEHLRLLGPLGYVLPAEYEDMSRQQQRQAAVWLKKIAP